MLVYQRYMAHYIAMPFLTFTFLITGIIWISQILKFLYLIDKGIRLSQFFSLIILIVPSLLFMVLPFSLLLAVIYTYNRFGEERQLIILKNSGLSNIDLAKPALFIATIVTICSYYISAILLPASYTKLKTDLNYFRRNYASSIVSEKTFNQISNSITLYVDKKSTNDSLMGVIVFDNRRSDSPSILFAKKGRFKPSGNNMAFELFNGFRQAPDSNGTLTKLQFDSLVVELTDNKIKSEEDNRDINEFYIGELLSPSNKLSIPRQQKMIAEGHQRLIWPLYNYILTFIALAVFLKMPYNKKSVFKQLFYTTVIVVGVTYLHFTIQNLTVKNFDMLFICYLNFILIIIFGSLLFKQRTL